MRRGQRWSALGAAACRDSAWPTTARRSGPRGLPAASPTAPVLPGGRCPADADRRAGAGSGRGRRSGPVDLWSDDLPPEERDWVLRQDHPGPTAKLIFAAKEAAYKAQYAHTASACSGLTPCGLRSEGDGFAATFYPRRVPLCRRRPDSRTLGPGRGSCPDRRPCLTRRCRVAAAATNWRDIAR